MKYIQLNKKQQTIVDDKDYEYLNQWKWYVDTKGYARHTHYLGKRDGKYQQIAWKMHRLVNNTPVGMETDHINRNKLDNRRMNLRSVTNTQNQMNRNLQKNNTSGYKGVKWSESSNKWVSQISVNRKRIYLGSYADIEAAWLARKLGERIYHDILPGGKH